MNPITWQATARPQRPQSAVSVRKTSNNVNYKPPETRSRHMGNNISSYNLLTGGDHYKEIRSPPRPVDTSFASFSRKGVEYSMGGAKLHSSDKPSYDPVQGKYQNERPKTAQMRNIERNTRSTMYVSASDRSVDLTVFNSWSQRPSTADPNSIQDTNPNSLLNRPAPEPSRRSETTMFDKLRPTRSSKKIFNKDSSKDSSHLNHLFRPEAKYSPPQQNTPDHAGWISHESSAETFAFDPNAATLDAKGRQALITHLVNNKHAAGMRNKDGLIFPKGRFVDPRTVAEPVTPRGRGGGVFKSKMTVSTNPILDNTIGPRRGIRILKSHHPVAEEAVPHLHEQLTPKHTHHHYTQNSSRDHIGRGMLPQKSDREHQTGKRCSTLVKHFNKTLDLSHLSHIRAGKSGGWMIATADETAANPHGFSGNAEMDRASAKNKARNEVGISDILFRQASPVAKFKDPKRRARTEIYRSNPVFKNKAIGPQMPFTPKPLPEGY